MFKNMSILLGAILIITTQACTQHKVEVAPVEIKPIHITIDVNVKVDKALDDFFSDIDQKEESADKAPSAEE